MNIDGKPQSMHWNGLEPTNELPMVKPSRSHHFSVADGQNTLLVYAVKLLNDKDFNLAWPQGTFCYTWHTLWPGGGRIREEKGPR